MGQGEGEEMIYVHTYYTGKFNSVRHVRVYEDWKLAHKQQEVLGGDVECYVLRDEIGE